MKTKNPNAVAIGILARGVPKRMSPAAIQQRVNASMAAKEARKVKAKEKAKLK
jgi:hypothetical protein